MAQLLVSRPLQPQERHQEAGSPCRVNLTSSSVPEPRPQLPTQRLQQPSATATAARPPPLNLAAQPLSTYALPLRQPLVATWLENCVKDAVKHVHEAPFVQLYLPGQAADSIRRHQVSEEFVQAPQVWQAIAEHLVSASPEVLVLVHPIHLVRQSAQKAASSQLARTTSSSVLTGVTAGGQRRRPRQLRPEQLEDLIESGLAHTQFSGRVGDDCCDDEVFSQIVPFQRGRQRSSHSSAAFAAPTSAVLEGAVQYHGVVVQSASESDVQGCYVLKTVQSMTADCQCTHYSLTRVSRGQPLADQLAASWLC